MTPPVQKVEFYRLRARLVRLQTLRKIERWIWGFVLAAFLIWMVSRA